MADEPNDKTAAQALQSLLDKHKGDAMALALQLVQENYELRHKNAGHRAEIEQLKGKVPAEGSITLSKADAQRWADYQALGKPEEVKQKLAETDAYAALGKVDEIKAKLSEGEALQGRLSAYEKEKQVREAAEAVGFNPVVLADRVGSAGLEITSETKDGKPVKSVSIKVKEGEAEKSYPLVEYAEKNWGPYMASLKANGQQGQQGTRYIEQGAGGKPPVNDIFTRIRQEAKEREEARKQSDKSLEERLNMSKRA